jgi:TRAP-type C4-dicarboxylate transport system permease small subunit
MDGFIDTVRRLSQLAGVVAAVLLGAAVVIVCQMVVMRYVLNQSTVWQTEFVTNSIVAATFIGSPYVLLRRGHVNVDLVPLYLPHRARLALALVASGAALLFCVVLAWSAGVLWHQAWAGHWTAATVWAPRLWIVYLPMVVGLVLLSLQYVVDIICLATGREMPFGMAPDSVAPGEPR